MEYCESLTPPKTVVKHALCVVRTRSHLQGLTLPSSGNWEMRIMGPVSSYVLTKWTGWNTCRLSWYQSQMQRYFFIPLSLRCFVLAYTICLFLYLRLNPAFNQVFPQSQWELQSLLQIQQDGVMKANLATTALRCAKEVPSFAELTFLCIAREAVYASWEGLH